MIKVFNLFCVTLGLTSVLTVQAIPDYSNEIKIKSANSLVYLLNWQLDFDQNNSSDIRSIERLRKMNYVSRSGKYTFTYKLSHEDRIYCEYLKTEEKSFCLINTNFKLLDENSNKVPGFLYEMMNRFYENHRLDSKSEIEKIGLSKLYFKDNAAKTYQLKFSEEQILECSKSIFKQVLYQCQVLDMKNFWN